MELIDVHAHFVPRDFPSGPVEGDRGRWPCLHHHGTVAAAVVIAGKTFREIDHRSWDAAARIGDMDRMGVARQALSPMPELLSYWFDAGAGLEMNRFLNAQMADVRAQYPHRFSALAGVPLQDPALAARELTRIRADGFAGVEIGSNVNGVVLGDARFDGFWAEAASLGLAVFVHALHPVGSDRLVAQPDLVPFAAFPLDTALAAASLIRAGVLERHPQLRIGFSHGGGAIVPLVHRLGQGARTTGNFAGQLQQSPAWHAAHFFYDSLVYDGGYLRHLAEVFAPGQVFVGTDYPYAIMDDDPAASVRAAALTDPVRVDSTAARRFLNLQSTSP